MTEIIKKLTQITNNYLFFSVFLLFSQLSFAMEDVEDDSHLDNRNHTVARVWCPGSNFTNVTGHAGTALQAVICDEVGHVSLEIVNRHKRNEYISLWPAGDTGNKIRHDADLYFEPELENDDAYTVIKLYSLNNKNIKYLFSIIEEDSRKSKKYRYSLTEEGPQYLNCCSLSLRLLKRSGVEELFPERSALISWGRVAVSGVAGIGLASGGFVIGSAVGSALGMPGMVAGGVSGGGFGGTCAAALCKSTWAKTSEKDDDLTEHAITPIQIARLVKKAREYEKEKYPISQTWDDN